MLYIKNYPNNSEVISLYCGENEQAKIIKKAYIGDKDGKAKPFWIRKIKGFQIELNRIEKGKEDQSADHPTIIANGRLACAEKLFTALVVDNRYIDLSITASNTTDTTSSNYGMSGLLHFNFYVVYEDGGKKIINECFDLNNSILTYEANVVDHSSTITSSTSSYRPYIGVFTNIGLNIASYRFYSATKDKSYSGSLTKDTSNECNGTIRFTQPANATARTSSVRIDFSKIIADGKEFIPVVVDNIS